MFGPASLAVGQTISAFTTFLPPLSTVRKATAEDTDVIGDVRLGEVAAVTVSLGTGAIVASITGSPLPILAGAIMALVLVCVYETALRGNRPFEPNSPLTGKVLVTADA
jgi:hypothetical protein